MVRHGCLLPNAARRSLKCVLSGSSCTDLPAKASLYFSGMFLGIWMLIKSSVRLKEQMFVNVVLPLDWVASTFRTL